MLRATQTAAGGCIAETLPSVLVKLPNCPGEALAKPFQGAPIRSHLGRAPSVASEAWLDQRRDLSCICSSLIVQGWLYLLTRKWETLFSPVLLS